MAISCLKVEVGGRACSIRACVPYCLYLSRRGALHHEICVSSCCRAVPCMKTVFETGKACICSIQAWF